MNEDGGAYEAGWMRDEGGWRKTKGVRMSREQVGKGRRNEGAEWWQ